MTTRKRNEWLEAEESEDDDRGYDSEIGERSRSAAFVGRDVKRRKTSDDSDADSDREDKVDKTGAGDDKNRDYDVVASTSSAAQVSTATLSPKAPAAPKPSARPLKDKHFVASRENAARTGVIYISRVPPFMKPQTVRQLLSPFGAVGRIFLTPEDPSAHRRRVRAGGNKKRSFTDGWVEFVRKKDAKAVAETLNAQIIGGKKGGWYHDDVWNIKYLKGFKWHNLTEQIAEENAARADRLRREIAQTTKENNLFLNNVERAKMLDGMEAKRQKKVARREEGEFKEAATHVDKPVEIERETRQFRQAKVRSRTAEAGSGEQPDEVRRVLSKIF